MKNCSSNILIFAAALLIGAAAVVFFKGHASFERIDEAQAPGAGAHYCSFETPDDEQRYTDRRLLDAFEKLSDKELKRLVKEGELTAQRADELRKEFNGAGKKTKAAQLIAQIDANCRREKLSFNQCDTRKALIADDIEQNILPVYDSFPNAVSFGEWRMKRKLEKRPAEVLFDENPGLGKM